MSSYQDSLRLARKRSRQMAALGVILFVLGVFIIVGIAVSLVCIGMGVFMPERADVFTIGILLVALLGCAAIGTGLGLAAL